MKAKGLRMNKKIDICIPTYNREHYVEELINELINQIMSNSYEEFIHIYISDNASSDSTELICTKFDNDYSFITYNRNDTNIGMNENFLKLFEISSSEYFWLFGDDEFVDQNCLTNVMNSLKTNHDLYICGFEKEYNSTVKQNEFKTFLKFVNYFTVRKPYMLLAHSLITCNIVKRTCFDIDKAKEKIPTFYAHMYGISSGLIKSKGSVLLLKEPTIDVRTERADPAEEWPDLVISWKGYYSYLVKMSHNILLFFWAKKFFLAYSKSFSQFKSFIKKIVRRNNG